VAYVPDSEENTEDFNVEVEEEPVIEEYEHVSIVGTESGSGKDDDGSHRSAKLSRGLVIVVGVILLIVAAVVVVALCKKPKESDEDAFDSNAKPTRKNVYEVQAQEMGNNSFETDKDSKA